eukprot:gene13867-13988_t
MDVTPAPELCDKDIHWRSCSSGGFFAVKEVPSGARGLPCHLAILLHSGQHVTLEPIMGSGEGRNKKTAEEAAAKQIYDTLVEEGWYDPSVPPSTSDKKAGVSRSTKFVVDEISANSSNPLAFLDISIDGSPVGRIVVELFRYKKGSSLELHAPLAVDNFLALCRGLDLGGRPLSFAGVPVTRVIRGICLQTGDVLNKDGTGGAHIHTSYGDNFPDEGLDDTSYTFARPFMLACANMGLEDTNSSQFLITLAPTHQFYGQHTCFGKVLAGFGVVKEIEASCSFSVHTCDQGPPVPVVIEAAGELPPGDLDQHPVAPVSNGGWPMWPEDQPPPSDGQREAAVRLNIAVQLKKLGNDAYKQGNATAALALYTQGLRYVFWGSIKTRTPHDDPDITTEEYHLLCEAEHVLMSNTAAAYLKLKRFRDALETCNKLLKLKPNNAKVLLRAAQARIALGPGEYSTAAGLLGQALQAAQDQQLPTADVVQEMHRLRRLQQQHTTKTKAVFSAAFSAGLLHHPEDDLPPEACLPAVVQVDDPAGAAAGLRHVAAAPGRLPTGPVGPERVLPDSRPVIVDDGWGTHLLMADDDGSEEEEVAVDDEADHDGSYFNNGFNSYGAGLVRRLQHLGLITAGESDEVAASGSKGNSGTNWDTAASEEKEEEACTGDGVAYGAVVSEAEDAWQQSTAAPGATAGCLSAAANVAVGSMRYGDGALNALPHKISLHHP